MKPVIVSIAGLSGAGKSFLAESLRKNHDFQEIVSTTTRGIREGEIDGVHYHFITKEEFLESFNKGEFVEKTYVNGNYYGVSKSEPLRLAKNNKPIVLVAEPEGVEQIKQYCKVNDWLNVSVFINSPIDVIEQRIVQRMHEEIRRVQKEDPQYEQKVDKIQKSNMGRLEHVKNFELEHWAAPALSKGSAFDFVFSHSDENNHKDIVSSILKKVEDLKKMDLVKKNEISKPKETAKSKIRPRF